jgi:hypothetical protein
MKIEDMVQDIVREGIPVTIKYNKETDEIRYYIPGFYKSDGSVYLVEEEGCRIFCYQRYGEKTELYDNNFMDSLVGVNYYWWSVTKERNPGSTILPDDYWKEHLIKSGRIKVVTKTEYV